MYIGRLAPSPTGLLHLGHARTFWIAHQRARAAQGKLILRDEDLDVQRCRPEFAAAMRQDLRWLGIAWDDDLRQSDRLPLYRAALDRLLAAGLAYPCTCSRRDLAQSITAPHEDPGAAAATGDEPLYNNHCRPASPHQITSERSSRPERKARSGETSFSPAAPQPFHPTTNYRLLTPAHETIRFTDLHAGPQSFTTGVDVGDFLIWRKALTADPQDIGLPSYQLACAVDDAAMNITEVVRGRDLLKSTARQILLQRALGYATPQYFHCDLLRDPNGVRLAKRHDALALRTLRDRGLTPANLIAMF